LVGVGAAMDGVVVGIEGVEGVGHVGLLDPLSLGGW